MRTSILFITCVITLNLLTAQNDLVSLDSEIITLDKIKTTVKGPNSNYLNQRKSIQSSRLVMRWAENLANYNLKDNSIFDDSEKAIYHIAFNNKQVKIFAQYDTNGKILSSIETYKDIRIPSELQVKISKAHPKCLFLKNSFHLNYNDKNGIDSQHYLIQIKKEDKYITLKFDMNFNAI